MIVIMSKRSTLQENNFMVHHQQLRILSSIRMFNPRIFTPELTIANVSEFELCEKKAKTKFA